MTVARCNGCGKTHAGAPRFCACGGEGFAAIEASGRGAVYSCTTLYAAAERFENDLPFQIAIVELEEGARLTARIAGAAVSIGDRVRLVEERGGVAFFSAA